MLGPIGNQTIIQNTPAARSAQGKTQARSDTQSTQSAQTSDFGAALQSNLECGSAASTDMFSATAFENTMNNWLIATIQRQNACRTEVYNQSMQDWKVNDARCRALGIASPPKPQAPQLEVAEAKPAGWWFQHNG